MHHLERPDEPPALREARRRGAMTWGDLQHEEISSIARILDEMQGSRCAYCEGILREGHAHIDHFRKRHDYPKLTFSWENLFRSCNADDHCARHKDRLPRPAAPNFDLLIDPCRDDPEDYLRFLSDGRVVPREGLSPHDQQRAEETIRVFGLNQPGLVQRRCEVLRSFLATLGFQGSPCATRPAGSRPAPRPPEPTMPGPATVPAPVLLATYEQTQPYATACYHALKLRRTAPRSN